MAASHSPVKRLDAALAQIFRGSEFLKEAVELELLIDTFQGAGMSGVA